MLTYISNHLNQKVNTNKRACIILKKASNHKNIVRELQKLIFTVYYNTRPIKDLKNIINII